MVKPTKRKHYDFLLEENPFVLRQEIFDRPESEWETIVCSLLWAIEYEAKKVLGETWASPDLMSEWDFWNTFGYRKDLNEEQMNAIVVLRSITMIRQEYFYQQKGHWFLKNHDASTGKIAMEMAFMMLASVRGNLLGTYGELLCEHRAVQEGRKKGAEERKKAYNLQKRFCWQQWESSSNNQGRPYMAALREKLRKEFQLTNKQLPSTRTLKKWIREKFPRIPTQHGTGE